jgi:CRP-like cAMP-binding protein
MSVSSLLRALPIFADLTERDLGYLATRCVSRTVGAGHMLFATDDVCRGLYVVESGRVRVYRLSPDGREQVLQIEGPGRAVGELPLFDGGEHPASAVTLERSQLVFLPREDFEELCRTQPTVAHAVIQSLGRQLRHLVNVTETLAFRDVAARLAMLLSSYADRIGVPTMEGMVLTLHRTQAELSLEIGAARESVSRAYRQLRDRGLIEMLSDHRLRIPDLERLRALARGG